MDERSSALSKRIADAHRWRVPFIVVVGPRDEAARRVSVREASEVRELDLARAVDQIAARCSPPPV